MTTTILQRKESKLLHANNRVIRHDGQTFKIFVQGLGKHTLANAEPIQGGQIIDLFNRTKLASELRNKAEQGLFS
jgi:hypothetical protein